MATITGTGRDLDVAYLWRNNPGNTGFSASVVKAALNGVTICGDGATTTNPTTTTATTTCPDPVIEETWWGGGQNVFSYDTETDGEWTLELVFDEDLLQFLVMMIYTTEKDCLNVL